MCWEEQGLCVLEAGAQDSKVCVAWESGGGLWGYSLGDGAGGGGTDHPLQVDGLKGHQDHADILPQLPEALGIHQMMRGFAPHVSLEPHCGRPVHPGKRRQ